MDKDRRRETLIDFLLLDDDDLELELSGGCGACSLEADQMCACCGRCNCDTHENCTRPAVEAAKQGPAS